MRTRVNNSTGRLKRVLLASPRFHKVLRVSDFGIAQIDSKVTDVDMKEKLRLYEKYKRAFEREGVEIIELSPDPSLPWQFFTRDFGLNSPWGVIVGRARYSERLNEGPVAEKNLREFGETVFSAVSQGVVEGGDCFWLDKDILTVGVGERTSESGVKFLEQCLKPKGVNIIQVPLYTKFNHLDMVFQPIENKVALVFRQALPDYFIGFLEGRGWKLIATEESHFRNCDLNVLCLGKGKVLSFKGNGLNKILGRHNIEPIEVDFSPFLRHGGGPHCASFELEREFDESGAI